MDFNAVGLHLDTLEPTITLESSNLNYSELSDVKSCGLDVRDKIKLPETITFSTKPGLLAVIEEKCTTPQTTAETLTNSVVSHSDQISFLSDDVHLSSSVMAKPLNSSLDSTCFHSNDGADSNLNENDEGSCLVLTDVLMEVEPDAPSDEDVNSNCVDSTSKLSDKLNNLKRSPKVPDDMTKCLLDLPLGEFNQHDFNNSSGIGNNNCVLNSSTVKGQPEKIFTVPDLCNELENQKLPEKSALCDAEKTEQEDSSVALINLEDLNSSVGLFGEVMDKTIISDTVDLLNTTCSYLPSNVLNPTANVQVELDLNTSQSKAVSKQSATGFVKELPSPLTLVKSEGSLKLQDEKEINLWGSTDLINFDCADSLSDGNFTNHNKLLSLSPKNPVNMSAIEEISDDVGESRLCTGDVHESESDGATQVISDDSCIKSDKIHDSLKPAGKDVISAHAEIVTESENAGCCTPTLKVEDVSNEEILPFHQAAQVNTEVLTPVEVTSPPVVDVTLPPVVELTSSAVVEMTTSPVVEVTSPPVVEETLPPVVELTSPAVVEMTTSPVVEESADVCGDPLVPKSCSRNHVTEDPFEISDQRDIKAISNSSESTLQSALSAKVSILNEIANEKAAALSKDFEIDSSLVILTTNAIEVNDSEDNNSIVQSNAVSSLISNSYVEIGAGAENISGVQCKIDSANVLQLQTVNSSLPNLPILISPPSNNECKIDVTDPPIDSDKKSFEEKDEESKLLGDVECTDDEEELQKTLEDSLLADEEDEVSSCQLSRNDIYLGKENVPLNDNEESEVLTVDNFQIKDMHSNSKDDCQILESSGANVLDKYDSRLSEVLRISADDPYQEDVSKSFPDVQIEDKDNINCKIKESLELADEKISSICLDIVEEILNNAVDKFSDKSLKNSLVEKDNSCEPFVESSIIANSIVLELCNNAFNKVNNENVKLLDNHEPATDNNQAVEKCSLKELGLKVEESGTAMDVSCDDACVEVAIAKVQCNMQIVEEFLNEGVSPKLGNCCPKKDNNQQPLLKSTYEDKLVDANNLIDFVETPVELPRAETTELPIEDNIVVKNESLMVPTEAKTSVAEPNKFEKETLFEHSSDLTCNDMTISSDTNLKARCLSLETGNPKEVSHSSERPLEDDPKLLKSDNRNKKESESLCINAQNQEPSEVELSAKECKTVADWTEINANVPSELTIALGNNSTCKSDPIDRTEDTTADSCCAIYVKQSCEGEEAGKINFIEINSRAEADIATNCEKEAVADSINKYEIPEKEVCPKIDNTLSELTIVFGNNSTSKSDSIDKIEDATMDSSCDMNTEQSFQVDESSKINFVDINSCAGKEVVEGEEEAEVVADSVKNHEIVPEEEFCPKVDNTLSDLIIAFGNNSTSTSNPNDTIEDTTAESSCTMDTKQSLQVDDTSKINFVDINSCAGKDVAEGEEKVEVVADNVKKHEIVPEEELCPKVDVYEPSKLTIVYGNNSASTSDPNDMIEDTTADSSCTMDIKQSLQVDETSKINFIEINSCEGRDTVTEGDEEAEVVADSVKKYGIVPEEEFYPKFEVSSQNLSHNEPPGINIRIPVMEEDLNKSHDRGEERKEGPENVEVQLKDNCSKYKSVTDEENNTTSEPFISKNDDDFKDVSDREQYPEGPVAVESTIKSFNNENTICELPVETSAATLKAEEIDKQVEKSELDKVEILANPEVVTRLLAVATDGQDFHDATMQSSASEVNSLLMMPSYDTSINKLSNEAELEEKSLLAESESLTVNTIEPNFNSICLKPSDASETFTEVSNETAIGQQMPASKLDSTSSEQTTEDIDSSSDGTFETSTSMKADSLNVIDEGNSSEKDALFKVPDPPKPVDSSILCSDKNIESQSLQMISDVYKTEKLIQESVSSIMHDILTACSDVGTGDNKRAKSSCDGEDDSMDLSPTSKDPDTSPNLVRENLLLEGASCVVNETVNAPSQDYDDSRETTSGNEKGVSNRCEDFHSNVSMSSRNPTVADEGFIEERSGKENDGTSGVEALKDTAVELDEDLGDVEENDDDTVISAMEEDLLLQDDFQSELIIQGELESIPSPLQISHCIEKDVILSLPSSNNLRGSDDDKVEKESCYVTTQETPMALSNEQKAELPTMDIEEDIFLNEVEEQNSDEAHKRKQEESAYEICRTFVEKVFKDVTERGSEDVIKGLLEEQTPNTEKNKSNEKSSIEICRTFVEDAFDAAIESSSIVLLNEDPEKQVPNAENQGDTYRICRSIVDEVLDFIGVDELSTDEDDFLESGDVDEYMMDSSDETLNVTEDSGITVAEEIMNSLIEDVVRGFDAEVIISEIVEEVFLKSSETSETLSIVNDILDDILRVVVPDGMPSIVEATTIDPAEFDDLPLSHRIKSEFFDISYHIKEEPADVDEGASHDTYIKPRRGRPKNKEALSPPEKRIKSEPLEKRKITPVMPTMIWVEKKRAKKRPKTVPPTPPPPPPPKVSPAPKKTSTTAKKSVTSTPKKGATPTAKKDLSSTVKRAASPSPASRRGRSSGIGPATLISPSFRKSPVRPTRMLSPMTTRRMSDKGSPPQSRKRSLPSSPSPSPSRAAKRKSETPAVLPTKKSGVLSRNIAVKSTSGGRGVKVKQTARKHGMPFFRKVLPRQEPEPELTPPPTRGRPKKRPFLSPERASKRQAVGISIRRCYVHLERMAFIEHLIPKKKPVNEPNICELCEPKRIFLSKESLVKHLKDEHRGALGSVSLPQVDRCAGCDRKYFSKTRLAEHMRTCPAVAALNVGRTTSRPVPSSQKNNLQPVLKCPVCERSFTIKTALESHMKSHEFEMDPLNLDSGVGPSRPAPPRETFASTMLRRSKKIIMKIKRETYQCQTCRAIYQTQAQLSQHNLIHSVRIKEERVSPEIEILAEMLVPRASKSSSSIPMKATARKSTGGLRRVETIPGPATRKRGLPPSPRLSRRKQAL